jgi:AraC-like DNA-binding protein
MSFIAEHAEPARRWTLLELAKLAGMSRTTFAERFREVVGQTPLDYLAGWRMRLAAERLHRTDDSVASIGFSVGSESEAEFSTAFRRETGCSPMQCWRKGPNGYPADLGGPARDDRKSRKTAPARVMCANYWATRSIVRPLRRAPSPRSCTPAA